MQKHYIPQYLDEPEKFIFWTVDEILLMMIPLVVGILLEQLLLGIIITGVVLIAYKKVKTHKNGLQYIQGYLYWVLPKNLLPVKNFPPSYLREFIG